MVNPIALAQSFLMDIATGTVSGDEMRGRAGLLARELEPYRMAHPQRKDTDTAGDGHRTLLDALLEDATEHEAAGRVIQAANARAAVENLRQLPPWAEEPSMVPKHHWRECRPALLGVAPERPTVAQELAVMAVWNQIPSWDRQAFHRVCCLQSRTPADLAAIERIQNAMAAVLDK